MIVATVSAWDLIVSLYVAVLRGIATQYLTLGTGDPFAAVLSGTDPSAWLGAMSFAALFVDLPFMVLALGVLFAWKALFLLYRIWRLLLGLIPTFS